MNSDSEHTSEGQAASFGQLVRYYRRQCTDPVRGGFLTQDRLGELIGEQMGDAGYTGAAVSEWERDKSKIHADDRRVLISLLAVLVFCGGLESTKQANMLLAAGNYRHLDGHEHAFVFKGTGIPVEAEDLVGPQDELGAPAEVKPHARMPEQLMLLEKVCSFWVEGVLQKSLQGMQHFAVPRIYQPEAIDHPWGDHLGPDLIVEAGAIPPASTFEIFREADRALLILGYPGSGKTTALISLAQEMINQARADGKKPIPVILDLASWARMPLDITDWVVEELTAKYQMPRQFGRQWIAANELVLLLDGLDTLPLASRRSCIQAINDFRESNGLTGVVVCSRSLEYEEVGELLNLNNAIVLHPLDDTQLADYLAQDGSTLAGLSAALESSPELLEMAHNPLMLNIMTAVFGGSPDDLSHDMAEKEMTIELLFDAYVARMFGQHVPHGRYDRRRTLAWLSWLAGGMAAHNQTIFLIEQLQPSWLPNRRWRRLYMLLAGAITGLAGGLIMWLLWRLLRLTLPQLPSPTSETIARLLGISTAASEPLTILLGNLVLGLLVGITLMILFEVRINQPLEVASANRQRWRQVVLIGLETGLGSMLFVLLFSDPLLALAWGVAEGFMYAAAARYVFGWSYQTEVRTVEALGWSWSNAAKGVLVGLGLAVVSELIETLLYGYNGAERTVLTLVVAGFILGGLRGRSADKKSRPNQGVWLSLRNAVIAALVLSVTMAALAWIIRDPLYAWQIGLLSAVVAAAIMGGTVFVKHFLLRAMFRYQGTVPWRYADFLDYASQLVLLRKVGNGYIFIHGLLQTYFARML